MMDSSAGNSSSKKPHRYKRDTENTQLIHSNSQQVYSTSDNTGNVFTTMSHQIIRTPPDGDETSHNLTLKTETAQQSRLMDKNSGCHMNASSSESTQVRLKSCNERNDVASNSKVVNRVCDKSSELKEDDQSNNKDEMYKCKINNVDYNIPSTSGTSNSLCDNLSENSGKKENRKRPSSLKLNRPNLDAESSSDTGNDDYSLGSEDGCIYTYRGGEHLADLPSSFFSLDMGLPLDNHLPIPPNYPLAPQAPNVREQGSRASSPDMDFLEMDFDPGPSCEVDSADESTPDVELDAVSIMPEENEPVLRGTTPEYVPGPRQIPQPAIALQELNNHNNVPSTSKGVEVQKIPEEAKDSEAFGPYITHINARGEELIVRRTMSQWPLTVPGNLHISSGDLVSPREILNNEEEHPESSFSYQINQGEKSSVDSANLSLTLYHLNMAKKLIAEKSNSDDGLESPNMDEAEESECVAPPRCMLWSEREACERQVTQIGTSACGATAVVNVFVALGVPVDIKLIDAAVGTRLRANNAPLPRYLLSRAVAGSTAADLVAGIQKASNGLVTARFFPTYPERAMSLSHWLADWISLGAVPILTLNLQAGCTGAVPDAWHHQMVFGVSPRGVFLCNPAGCVREEALWPQLASPSVLLVETRDVVARFEPNTDLTPLMLVPDRRFHTFNVLGQVVNVIREWRARGWGEGETEGAGHVRLPAAYQAGVTVAALTGTEAHRRLVHAHPLPILPLGPLPHLPHLTHDPHHQNR